MMTGVYLIKSSRDTSQMVSYHQKQMRCFNVQHADAQAMSF